MKKLIEVPVGTEPKIMRYPYGGSEYIDYGYASHRLCPHSSLKSLINELTWMMKENRDRYQDMTFREKRDCGCMHDCSCSPSYVLYGKRYETEVEYRFRLKKEAESRAATESREKEMYEKLKNKFERG